MVAPARIYNDGAQNRLELERLTHLALLTTYPALALLGKADLSHLATAIGVALFLLAISRLVWTRSIRSYAGASS